MESQMREPRDEPAGPWKTAPVLDYLNPTTPARGLSAADVLSAILGVLLALAVRALPVLLLGGIVLAEPNAEGIGFLVVIFVFMMLGLMPAIRSWRRR